MPHHGQLPAVVPQVCDLCSPGYLNLFFMTILGTLQFKAEILSHGIDGYFAHDLCLTI